MSEWSFKPAILRRAQVWRLEGTRLSGPDEPIDLADVDRAAFVDQTVKGYRFIRLDLWQGDRRLSVPITMPAAAGSEDPGRAEFIGLVRAIAERLAADKPDLPVTLGEYGRRAFGMFVVGLMSLVFGLGIGLAAIASGVSADRLGAAAVPVLLLIVFGGLLAWVRRPWKPALTIPAKSLPAVLEAYGVRQSSAAASAEGE